jgi:hypothetical protein
MKAAAKGTTLSKQRPVECHDRQNISRAGRSIQTGGVRYLMQLQLKPPTPEEHEAVALDQWLIAGRKAAEAEHAAAVAAAGHIRLAAPQLAVLQQELVAVVLRHCKVCGLLCLRWCFNPPPMI